MNFFPTPYFPHPPIFKPNKKLVLLGNIFNHPDLFLKLFGFEDLKDGWNAGSGLPVPSKVIYKAAQIMSEVLTNPIEVFPTGRESVQLEWGDFEIEIFDRYDDDKEDYGIESFMDFMEEE
jgi:hypothetical protein